MPPHLPLTVSNCDDSGPGSLRDAVASAASGDTIYLGQLACSAITLTSGAIEVPQYSLDIKYYYLGEGRGSRLTIDANRSSRVFHHTGAGTLNLVGLVLENGRYDNTDSNSPLPAVGGCIYSTANVSLSDSTVTGCTAYDGHGQNAAGGGIYALEQVSLSHSTLSDNAAYSLGGAANGGGAFASGAISVSYTSIEENIAAGTNSSTGGGFAVSDLRSTATLINYSAIIDNTADRGGGAFISGAATDGAFVQLLNSTISGNVGNVSSGAMYLRGAAGIFSGTIAFNYSYQGPGVELAPQTSDIHVYSSIIADNTNSSDYDYDIGSAGYAVTIAGSHNIIIVAAYSVLVPPDTVRADPLLLPLSDNGGETLTHALGDGSPAIDTGTNLVDQATYDQRGPGFPRSMGTAADIGAFERQITSDAIFADGFDGAGRSKIIE